MFSIGVIVTGMSHYEPEPLEHIIRPGLPWRLTPALTECGREPEGLIVLTRDEAVAKFRKLGRVRGTLTTCITCYQTAERWPSWDENPVQALGREIDRRRYSVDSEFRRELLALAMLAEKYRDEFVATLDVLAGAPSLDEARRKRRQRG